MSKVFKFDRNKNSIDLNSYKILNNDINKYTETTNKIDSKVILRK